MALPFATPPEKLCVLRLSAVGDICHTLPVVRTIQNVWPETKITWIIGSTEASLIGDIPDIEFLVFNKSKKWQAYTNLVRQLRRQRFDALLHMQMSARSSIINRLVKTDVRIGFDRDRTKDFQWLVNNHQIPAHKNQHVMDSLYGFAEALGITEKIVSWNIPIPDQDKLAVKSRLPNQSPFIVISPCSSMAYRNWNVAGYATIADYVAQKHGLQVVLSGGPSSLERQYGFDIEQLTKHKPINFIGKTNLKQLLYLLDQARFLISPDSGPAHMATAVKTPVIGLYACTNPQRARPYFSADTVIDKYAEAVQEKFGKSPNALPWGTRVRDRGTMDRITADEVIAKIDLLVQTS